MNSVPKPWFPHYGPYDGKFPPYYDLDGIAWYDELKKNIPAIIKELLAFLKTDEVQVKEHFNASLFEGKGWWGAAFMFWGLRNEKTIDKGRRVFDYFKNIPGVVSVSVSVLQPGTRIKGHTGDTDAIYRVHIPVYIPAGLPDCGLTVAGITKPWVENDLIVFCDAYFHEAWNMTDKPRTVIILDVIKEELLSQTDDICAMVLTAMKYQGIMVRLKFVEKIRERSPMWVKNFVRTVLKFIPMRLN